MVATVCPRCHRDGKRVEMKHTHLEGKPEEVGDRFPGNCTITLEHYFTSKWTCPDCNYEENE